MYLKFASRCRGCGNDLTPLFSLGSQFLQGSFNKGDLIASNRKIPMDLYLCDTTKSPNACGLLQLGHTVPPSILYKNYWYRSGITKTMKDHLYDIYESIISLNSGIKRKVNLIDIGCNDCTFLDYFKNDKKFSTIGIDPSNIASSAKNRNNHKIINSTFPNDYIESESVDYVTSFAMLYDVHDLGNFLYNINRILKKDGFWIFEVAYLPSMLKNNAFDNICHEHLSYFSLASLESILSSHGLYIHKVEINNTNCGSILCYAKKTIPFFTDSEIINIREKEFDLSLDDTKTYYDFFNRINSIRKELVDLINSITRSGKTIHVYGASTKGNVLLQYCGVGDTIDSIKYAAERSQEKIGATTVGTNIQIISEEESKLMNPDYYLVLPWHFKDEIIKREQTSIELGIKFIFPLPFIDII